MKNCAFAYIRCPTISLIPNQLCYIGVQITGCSGLLSGSSNVLSALYGLRAVSEGKQHRVNKGMDKYPISKTQVHLQDFQIIINIEILKYFLPSPLSPAPHDFCVCT